MFYPAEPTVVQLNPRQRWLFTLNMVKGSLPVLLLARTRPRRLKPALPGGQARNFHHRPDFYGSPTASRDSLGNPDGLIEVIGVDQEVPAELFARFSERAVGD